MAVEETAPAAKKISLFNGKDFTSWTLHLSKPNVDPASVWSVRNGLPFCTGTPSGYMRTNEEYSNYKLTFEWRWTGRPGNNGCLVHMYGKDTVWPKSIEVQLAHENAGDFWVIGGTEFNQHKDKSSGRVSGRNVKKLEKSNEKPPGQWNKMEIICKGDKIRVYVNGLLQNEADDCRDDEGKPLTKGKICFQSEGAPIEYRNIILEPLK
ncbi:MAG: hypothetical protein AMJ84_10605 [Acidithiobacillales bacterium SM23_46]|nr:MAG: hypothetical protein AMJ84_10605 [Acidithiobacillales bacterium SM23_46]